MRASTKTLSKNLIKRPQKLASPLW